MSASTSEVHLVPGFGPALPAVRTTLFISPATLQLSRRQPMPLDEGELRKPDVSVDGVQLLKHRAAALRAMGIRNLRTLGTLQVSGNVVPRSGVFVPGRGSQIMQDNFHRVMKLHSSSAVGAELRFAGGVATAFEVGPARSPALRPTDERELDAKSNVLTLDTAYWAANEIVIGDGTLIILKQRYLVMIANKITLGANVTISWEQASLAVPRAPAARPKQPRPPTSTTLRGTNGQNGINGEKGGPGVNGAPGPEVEIWAETINRLPTEVLLGGQDGVLGGGGQPGQDGQDGAKGRGFIPGTLPLTCKSGPGDGGDGGRGGKGGSGGDGGDGGNGGRLMVFAPAAVLNVISALGTYCDFAGGSAGGGGAGGRGGRGGEGGRAGNERDGIGCPGNFGRPGADGVEGATGSKGRDGRGGAHHQRAYVLQPITEGALQAALVQPAIERLAPMDSVVVGQDVTASGHGFAKSDVIFVGEVAARTTFISDTALAFVVPAGRGGRGLPVTLRHADGSRSNRAALNVVPRILEFEQDGNRAAPGDATRFNAGKMIRVIGSGFAPGFTVMVGDQFVPQAKTRYVNDTLVEFELLRPGSVERNPLGERVHISLALPDGSKSGRALIRLDTLNILVLGDSIQWGQGLRSDLKIHALVAKRLAVDRAQAVYTFVHAHSGAVIGINDARVMQPLDGEVPTSYPTILQQARRPIEFGDQSLTVPGELIDLVIVDGGINDVSVNDIINPFSALDLKESAHRHCCEDMKVLLRDICHRYINAVVVVSGYYQILSHASTPSSFPLFLAAIGLEVPAVLSQDLVGRIAERCQLFADQANRGLRQAVAAVVNELHTAGGARKIVFADPRFQPQNAMFAPDSWLWGLELDSGPADDYQLGGVEADRKVACDRVAVDEPARSSHFRCIRASAGHPSRRGAQALADAIMNALGN